MTQHDNQTSRKALDGKLDTPHLGGRNDVAGNPYDKEIAKALVKNNLSGNAGVRTSQNDGKRCLLDRQRSALHTADR